jgi:hypothetical protein
LLRQLTSRHSHAVASNPACPPELLSELTRDPNVRYTVASNPACPPEQLRELARDPHQVIAVAAADNPNYPA